jgi:hypothetical protein
MSRLELGGNRMGQVNFVSLLNKIRPKDHIAVLRRSGNGELTVRRSDWAKGGTKVVVFCSLF